MNKVPSVEGLELRAGGISLSHRRAFLDAAARWGALVALTALGVETVRRQSPGGCGATAACAGCSRWDRCDLPLAREARLAGAKEAP